MVPLVILPLIVAALKSAAAQQLAMSLLKMAAEHLGMKTFFEGLKHMGEMLDLPNQLLNENKKNNEKVPETKNPLLVYFTDKVLNDPNFKADKTEHFTNGFSNWLDNEGKGYKAEIETLSKLTSPDPARVISTLDTMATSAVKDILGQESKHELHPDFNPRHRPSPFDTH